MKKYFFLFALLAFFFGFFFVPHAYASISIVQHSSAFPGPNGSICTVNISSTAAGDLVWGWIGGQGALPSSYTVTSTVAQTWTAGALSIGTNSVEATGQGFYVANASSGITQVTFTRSLGGVGYLGCYVVELSGVATVSPLDAQATSTTATTTAPSSNPFTLSNANDIVLTGGTDVTNRFTFSANGGSTLLNAQNSESSADEYEIFSSSLTTSTSFSMSGNGDGVVMNAMAFEAATSTSGNATGYAWGNKIGWTNFGTSQGNFLVGNSNLTGYVWSQNFGWINLSPTDPIVNVQNASSSGEYGSGSNTTASATFLNNTASGDTIIVGIQYGTSVVTPTTISCSDPYDATSTYVVAETIIETSDQRGLAILYSPDIVGGTTPTVTCTLSTARPHISMAIHEYSGIAGTSPLDATSTNLVTGAPSLLQTGTSTTNVNGELIFGAFAETSVGSGDTYTAGTGFTKRIDQGNTASSSGYVDEDAVQGTAGAVSATMTLSPTGRDYIAALATFKPLSSSGYGVTNDGLGDLQGYAWSPDAGWINFGGVTITSTGTFQGIASGSVAGSVNFNCTYCLVNTTWRSSAPNPVTISNTTLNGGSSIVLTPNATTSVSVTATVTDTNGCGAINGGTSTFMIYRSGVGSSTCIASPNNADCYVLTAPTVTSGCSAGTLRATTTFSVYYFAQATDASSSFPGQDWIGTVDFTDALNATGTEDSTGQSLLTLNALNVIPGSLNYGTVNPNLNTGSTNQVAQVENVGNSSDTLEVSGTALTFGANTIATSSQHYDTLAFTYGVTGGQATISASPTTVTGFLLTVPTSTTVVSSSLYWGIAIPSSDPSGTYSGTDTFISTFSP